MPKQCVSAPYVNKIGCRNNSAMKSFSKKLFFYLILLVMLAAFIFIVAEYFARYMVYEQGKYLSIIDHTYYSKLTEKDPPYQFEKRFYTFDTNCGWLQTPANRGIFRGFTYPKAEFRNKIEINSLGFRSSSEYGIDRNKVRIAMLGDSFLQALQVSEKESLPKVIEHELLSSHQDVRVYNFGVSSTGTVHQYQIFFNKALKIKPDIVILLFFPNDLIDNSPHYQHESNMLIPRYAQEPDGSVSIKDFSDTPPADVQIKYRFASGKPTALRTTIENIGNFAQKKCHLVFLKFFSLFISDMFIPTSDYDASFDVYKKEYPEFLKESVITTVRLIKQLDSFCKVNGIKFLVVFIPAKEQFNQRDWDAYVRTQRRILKKDMFDTDIPTTVMKNALTELKIHNLDLLPLFKKSYKNENLYYAKDLHFNPKGHQRAGEIIAKFLLTENLRE